MSLEIIGKLLVKYDTQVVSDRFKKREFVLEMIDETPNGNYTNYARMQLVQNKTELLDRFNEGDSVKVSFNIKGSKYEKNGTTSYFTNLDAWRIEPADAAGSDMNAGGYSQNSGYENAASGGYNSGYNGGRSDSNSGGFSATSTDGADDLPF
ncbi:MAG: DUF3127 domain-containing protein [Sphingobacteriales bacterium]|nr:MAG: DUF3127 domain-containing protein [Sphingobacteriales bacterium]